MHANVADVHPVAVSVGVWAVAAFRSSTTSSRFWTCDGKIIIIRMETLYEVSRFLDVAVIDGHAFFWSPRKGTWKPREWLAEDIPELDLDSSAITLSCGCRSTAAVSRPATLPGTPLQHPSKRSAPRGGWRQLPPSASAGTAYGERQRTGPSAEHVAALRYSFFTSYCQMSILSPNPLIWRRQWVPSKLPRVTSAFRLYAYIHVLLSDIKYKQTL